MVSHARLAGLVLAHVYSSCCSNSRATHRFIHTQVHTYRHEHIIYRVILLSFRVLVFHFESRVRVLVFYNLSSSIPFQAIAFDISLRYRVRVVVYVQRSSTISRDYNLFYRIRDRSLHRVRLEFYPSKSTYYYIPSPHPISLVP